MWLAEIRLHPPPGPHLGILHCDKLWGRDSLQGIAAFLIC